MSTRRHEIKNMPTTSATPTHTAPPASPPVAPNLSMTNEHPMWQEFIDRLDVALDKTACKGREQNVGAQDTAVDGVGKGGDQGVVSVVRAVGRLLRL
ncbi:MAG TPA: hypothetical protein VGK19_18340 [Capsulimonadaceae bacterium]